MKRKFLQGLMFAAAVIALASCGDDDDDKAPANYITYDGTTKGIVTAVAFPGSKYTGADGKVVYGHDLSFGDVSMDSPETAAYSAVHVTVYTATEDLADGTYTVIDSKTRATANTANSGDVSIDTKYSEDGELVSGKEYDIISGTVTLKKSGDSYAFDFTGKAAAEGAAASTAKDVKVHYNGTFIKF